MRISEVIGVLLIFALIAFVYGAELLFLAVRIKNKIAKRESPPLYRSRYFWIVHVLALAGAVCFIDGFIVEPNWIDVTRIEIETHN